MDNLEHLFKKNRDWAARTTAQEPDFFKRLSQQQAPEYLWIGCSDSRVPANEIVDLLPGELFVHRNVANVVAHSDLNCLSVLQFAVDVLKVKHVMVTGHYGCGGVQAVLKQEKLGLVDNWLSHVQDVLHQHTACVNCQPDDKAKGNLLCELNVIEQVLNVSRTTVVRDAWARGQKLTLHGWVYALDDGLIRDMGLTCSGHEEARTAYDRAIASRRLG